MPVGYHEFRFFGGDGKYYLSHFPMFSSIHAFQYIVEVELDKEATQSIAKAESEDLTRKRRYQLSPYRKGSVSSNRAEDEEDWVLPDTLQSGKVINGDIFYFEDRDRHIVIRNAEVKIKEIVWKQELNPKFPRPTALTYILFGTPKAAFLAHQISAPPKPGKQETDFDQVLSLETVTTSKGFSPVTAGKLVIASGVENLEKNKLQPKQQIKLNFLGNEQEAIEVVVRDELQMEQLATQR
ncbi:MAG: hypothetical protein KGQ60_01955 [Planctomycetes bacterium]|nr:hypothetical protein [Planctomycetota bacterium]